MDSHQINGRLFGSEWVFWVDDAASAPLPQRKTETTIQPPREFEGVDSPAAKFERQARSKMSKFFNTVLREMGLDGVRKRFDFVSEDGEIVGDAKYYSMVKGERFPPAKISVITEHVWLLEKTNARQKFLVFGNDRRVPAAWLERFGELVDGVDFYFLSDDDELTKLN